MSRPPGQVFTPAAFATKLASAALDRIDLGRRSRLRVIDPTAGDGALIAAVLEEAEARRVVCEVTAVELDSALVDRMRTRFGTRVRVVQGDALALTDPHAVEACVGGPAPRDVARVAPDLFEPGRFDLVIANPPWLRETGNASLFRRIRAFANQEHAGVYRKDADLHHFFWPICMRLCRRGGVVALLTPAYVFDSDAGTPVRTLVTGTGQLLGVWRSGALMIFRDAAVESAVTLWKRGEKPGLTDVLDDDLRPLGRTVDLRDARRWRLEPPAATDGVRVGDLFDITEGISTGADAVSRRNASRAPGTFPGEGIFVLRHDELDNIGLSESERARFVRPIHHATRNDFLLAVRDGDLPALEAGELADPGAPALSRHLRRFEGILRTRAEVVRNPRRSWYALLWPRAALDRDDVIVTPKWAARPSFVRLKPGKVAMTDHRVLVPRVRLESDTLDAIVDALNSAETAGRFAATLKRRGPLLEFYGSALLDCSVQLGVLPIAIRE